MKKFIHVIFSMIVLMMLSACGGGGGDSEVVTPPDTLTFEEVSEGMNAKNVALFTSSSSYIEKYNALMAYDPTGVPLENMFTPLDEMIASAEGMLKDVEDYQSLLAQYHEYTVTTKSIDLRQSVDPLLIYDIKLLIDQGLKEKEILEEMKASGQYTDEQIAEAMKDKTIKGLKDVTNFGASAIFGGGAAAFAGLAAGAAGAPVLVVVGGATAVGLAAGAFFSWCTSDITKAEEPATCAMVSVQSEMAQLPGGQIGFSFTVSPGEGSLCMEIKGHAPVCIDSDFKEDGNTISIDCLAEIDDPVSTKECNDAVTNEEDISIIGEVCTTDVYTVSATPTSVSTSGATVTIKTVLPTEGCSIDYSLVGTDGYTQSGTLLTDSAGITSFNVPAGAESVHDDVNVIATESGVSTTAGYTF